MALQVKRRLLEHIKAMVACGAYRDGDKLPSLRVFAEQFGMTPSTARNAILELEKSGLVTMRQGDGIYICINHAEKPAAPRYRIAVFAEGASSLELAHSYGSYALQAFQEEAAANLCRVEIHFSDFYNSRKPLVIGKEEIRDNDGCVFLGLFDWNPLFLPVGIPAVGLHMGASEGGRLSTVGIDCFAGAKLARRFFSERKITKVKCFYFNFGACQELFRTFRSEFEEVGTVEGHILTDNHPSLELFRDQECGYLIFSGTACYFVQNAYEAQFKRRMTDDLTLLSVDGKSRYMPEYRRVSNIGIDWRQAGKSLFTEMIFRINHPELPGRRIFMTPDLETI